MPKTKEPITNLFIPGFAKSGTTALYHYLQTHPQIFFPSLKEPHFFANDFKYYRNIRRKKNYRDLYLSANNEKILGDGSVFYLYSQNALENIKDFNPDARFIVCLRNPVDMLPSLHQQFLSTYFEDIKDCESAWRAMEHRAEGKRTPKGCPDKSFLDYASCCAIGTQLEKLYGLFPADQILCIFLDDIKKDMRAEYLKIMSFLNIEDDERTDFPIINEASAPKYPFLSQLLSANSPAKRWLKRVLRYLFPSLPMGFGSRLAGKAALEKPAALSPSFKQELYAFFKDEITKTEKITGRNLDHWEPSSGQS